MTRIPSIPAPLRLRPSWRLGFASALLATLCACGGGGSNGGTTAPPGGGGSTTSSGLVPAAPTAGAVPAADATQLRVVRAGASWTFRGFDQPDSSAAPGTVFTDVDSHAAASGGTAETTSNGANEGSDTSVLVVSGGFVKTSVTLPTGLGRPETFDDIELRSPVRVDDQYAVYDRHFDNGGTDFDGNGINDALDCAPWRRVVGSEVLDPHHRRQVSTVRVDATLRARVRYGHDGSYSAVVEVVQSIWYAPGLGTVRVRVDRPNDNVPTLRHVTTEELLTWDGLTEGVGPLPAQAAALAATTGSTGITPVAVFGLYTVGGTQVADLKVQGFDAAGAAVAAVDVVLESGVNPNGVANVRATTSATDPVLVSRTFTGLGEGRYAVIDPSTGALLARRTGTQTGYPPDNLVIEPGDLDPGLTLNSALDPVNGVLVGVGVGLDAAYNALRSTTAFTSEIVSPSWLQPVQGYGARPVGRFDHLFAYGYSRTLEFPQDALVSSLPTLVEVIPGSTLAAGEVRLLARLPFGAPGASSGALLSPPADRVLIVGAGTGPTLSTTPVWREP